MFGVTDIRPSFLENDLRFILFGGKGGVGKTTSAVAVALYLAEQNPNKKILLVSTDPAHSVGDSLGQHVGDQTVPVQGVANLFAREADAGRLLAEFKLKHGPVLAKIADRGTCFDKDDIRSFLDLSLPGMDEFMAVLELMELVRTRQYDVIIMDTAPTGHTIRLLELPGLLQQWVSILDLMMKKHRFMAETFSRRRYRPDECDRWLETMAADAKRVERLLQDAAATEFVVVTIPEEMAVAESERLVAALKKFRIPIRNLIVNHVVEQNLLCPFCQERRNEQAGSLERIEREFADLHILKLPQFPCEVHGMEFLRRFARFFADGAQANAVESCAGAAPTAVSEVPQRGSPLVLPTARLVLIGGKGGVGKSSVAAATAIELASRFPEKKVLIFSTDPAHSLSDSFGQKIGTEIGPIEGIPNLSAQEIDAPKLLVDFKRRYRESVDDIFNSFLSGSGVKVDFDQEVMERLLDLSPPGIDEVMALIEVMELMEGRAFDIFVLDTAPTGHLLRFLEMPEIAGDWLGAAMKVIRKYQGLAKLGSVAGLVMKYASQVRKLRKQLLDAAGAEIIVVTIPEAMGVVEMNRLIQALRKFEIACRQIVINMVTPPNDCSFCSLKRNEEQRYVREVIAQCPDHQVACVPRLPHPIHGLTTLLEFKRILWGDTTRKEPRNRSRGGATADLAPAPASLPGIAGIRGTAGSPLAQTT
jgi:arsenite-transporting ATPase